jgi:hypothetical protein
MTFLTKTAALAASCLLAVSAQATVYSQTWTGTVIYSDNGSNMFGGGNLTNAAFVAQYLFDDTVGDTYSDSEDHYADGGDLSGYDSPSLLATLTINGITARFSGTLLSAFESFNAADQSGTASLASSYGTLMLNELGSNTGPGYGDPSFSSSIDVTDAYQNDGAFIHGLTTLGLQNLSYTAAISSATAVPEPAVWAMMLGGFGLLGAALRRKPAAVRFG